MKTNLKPLVNILIKLGYEYNPSMHRWELEGSFSIGAKDVAKGYIKEENGKLKFNFPKEESVLAGWFEFA